MADRQGEFSFSSTIQQWVPHIDRPNQPSQQPREYTQLHVQPREEEEQHQTAQLHRLPNHSALEKQSQSTERLSCVVAQTRYQIQTIELYAFKEALNHIQTDPGCQVKGHLVWCPYSAIHDLEGSPQKRSTFLPCLRRAGGSRILQGHKLF